MTTYPLAPDPECLNSKPSNTIERAPSTSRTVLECSNTARYRCSARNVVTVVNRRSTCSGPEYTPSRNNTEQESSGTVSAACWSVAQGREADPSFVSFPVGGGATQKRHPANAAEPSTDGACVTPTCREHQCAASVLGLKIYLCTSFHELLRGFVMTKLRCPHQRGLTVSLDGIRVGSRAQ